MPISRAAANLPPAAPPKPSPEIIPDEPDPDGGGAPEPEPEPEPDDGGDDGL